MLVLGGLFLVFILFLILIPIGEVFVSAVKRLLELHCSTARCQTPSPSKEEVPLYAAWPSANAFQGREEEFNAICKRMLEESRENAGLVEYLKRLRGSDEMVFLGYCLIFWTACAGFGLLVAVIQTKFFYMLSFKRITIFQIGGKKLT